MWLAIGSLFNIITLSAAAIIVVFWIFPMSMTLHPPQIKVEINHQAYIVNLSTLTPIAPTPTPQPTITPSSRALITNIVGHPQLYTLDCEARSAVDLAAYFGVTIDEQGFLKQMPHSPNPNSGFVGNISDPRGRIPPLSYGIYAGPIAALLRSYGLNAIDQHGMSFETIKDEITAGRPVMVWFIGNTETGWGSTSYTMPDGQKVLVAPFEHTVLITGYDPNYVDILDGNSHYQRFKVDFLKSWGMLGNMAVTISR
jgi:uncharacterized protein YvpB